MRAVIQRVSSAGVVLKVTGERRVIGSGLLTLLAIAPDDRLQEVRWLVDKLTTLRLFEDEEGKMNQSLLEIEAGEMLIVSQFTLLGDTHKGRRPSFTGAARPEIARPLYESFVTLIRETGLRVQTGEFGAAMSVEIVNDGPITLIVDTPAGIR
jgi:D-tyrosyl-tRNA(Tyr) deacylase